MTTFLLAAGLAAASAGFCWTGWVLFQLTQKYRPLIDVDNVLAQRKRTAEALAETQRKIEQQIQQSRDGETARQAAEDASLAEARKRNDESIKRDREEFMSKYTTARETYERLQREISLLEADLDDISFGIYTPHFDFKTSAEYKAKLEAVYERQKQLIRAQGAAHFGTEWAINGSKSEGVKMQKQYAKLMLRGFNGECDAAIARVAWNNINGMLERIQKSFESLNTLGAVMNISITPEYMNLRLEELRVSYEMEEKKHAEIEEQRRIRAQMRDEEKAQHEIQLAQKKAEEDEAHYAHALREAQAHMAEASGEELKKLGSKVEELQQQLALAQQNKARAISRAQLTKSGHLYIVSNIGSFGEGIYKIGMTRRLDPLERVQELNDASVPFGFDVHGMIYSDDVPSLEHEIHVHFQNCQLNRVNSRKEFFRLSLDELGTFAKTKNLKLELTLLAEAREYRETMALLQQLSAQQSAASPSGGPPMDFPHVPL